MAKPGVRFAEALRFLRKLQNDGVVGIHTAELSNRYDREILLKNGYLKAVTKGWYMAVHPKEQEDETTAWYSGYWAFCSRFLNHKYRDDWCLSADQSLLIHAGNRLIPRQLTVCSSRGNNLPTTLPQGSFIFNKRALLPPAGQVVEESGIRMYALRSALVYASPDIYRTNALDVRTALLLIRNASEVLPILLENGHSTLAGRLAGAFRNIKRHKIADQIMETVSQAGYDVREKDPFKNKMAMLIPSDERSPYGNRIRVMWSGMRGIVMKDFRKAPGIPDHHEGYMKDVDDGFVTDAYHSLAMAGYSLAPELLAKVGAGEWTVKGNGKVWKQSDEVVARGYCRAFQRVKETIAIILNGTNAGYQTEVDHSAWYSELFGPSVTAGLCKASDLVGYRQHQVYTGHSRHIPVDEDATGDAMAVLFDLLFEEPEACVRAVLGHFIFLWIHPYMGGNGRMGRLLMNTMLASGGYPWTVIPVEMRTAYRQALERAAVDGAIRTFSKFIASLVHKTMRGSAVAVLPVAGLSQTSTG